MYVSVYVQYMQTCVCSCKGQSTCYYHNNYVYDVCIGMYGSSSSSSSSSSSVCVCSNLEHHAAE